MQSIRASISPFSLIRLFLKYELCSCLTPGHIPSQDAASARMDQFDGKEHDKRDGPGRRKRSRNVFMLAAE